MKRLITIKRVLFTIGLFAATIPFCGVDSNKQLFPSVSAGAPRQVNAYANGGSITTNNYWKGNSEKATKTVCTAETIGNFPKVTRTGYKLDGWYDAITDGRIVRTSDKMGVSDIDIYAYWTAETYNVIFDKQSGTGGTSGGGVTYDQDMPTITVPTRTGYTFQGYYSGTNGSGSKYYTSSGTSANKYDIANDTTLYAYWTANAYSVTLNQQSGTGGTSSVTATYDSSMPMITIPTRTGYTFQGYYSGSNGTGTSYYSASGTSNHVYDLTSETTLYAYWVANSYGISYMDKGNKSFSGTHESGYPTSHTYGTGTVLKNATKTGFNFRGWFTSSDCSGSAITTLDATSFTSNITLYALWTEDSSYKPVLVNSIGGCINDKGTKKQFIAFGFQVSDVVYNSLVNDSDFGIIAYKSGTNEIEYSNGTVEALKTNEGRFYIYLIDESNDAATYYAKAFVKFNGSYIYSELVSQTGDLFGLPYVID